jgi:DNA-binding HxlR family transcriptional regulator
VLRFHRGGADLRLGDHPRVLGARKALERDDPQDARQGVTSLVGLRKAVSGISDTVLAERLLELADAGLVTRAVSEGPLVGVRYELTSAGAELVPMISQLEASAKRNLVAQVEHV